MFDDAVCAVGVDGWRIRAGVLDAGGVEPGGHATWQAGGSEFGQAPASRSGCAPWCECWVDGEHTMNLGAACACIYWAGGLFCR